MLTHALQEKPKSYSYGKDLSVCMKQANAKDNLLNNYLD